MSGSYLSEDQVARGVGYKRLFFGLWPFLSKYKIHLGIVVVAIFTLAAVSRALPFLIGYAIDEGFTKKDLSLVVKVAWVYLALEIFKTILMFTHKFLFQKLGNRVLADLRMHLLNHVQNLPMGFFHKHPTGRTVTRMTNDVSVLSEVFSEGVVTLFSQLAVLISIGVALLWISPKVTFLTMITAPVFVYWAYKLSVKVKFILRDQKKKLSEINSFVAEHLSGIRVAQLYNQVPSSETRFAGLSKSYRDLNMESVKAYAMMHPALNLLNASVIVSALFWAGSASLENSLPLGAVVAFVLSAQDIIPPIREILEKYQLFQNSLTSAERVFGLLEEKAESSSMQESSMWSLNRSVYFKNLNFSYGAGLPNAISNLNLEIPTGQSLALVGRTGSGKSTLVSLLQGLYEPPARTLFFGDVAIEDIPKSVLRQRVGVIQQEPFLFQGNILNNIRLSDQNLSDQKIESAANEIGFLDYLKTQGRSLTDQVQDRGQNLSLGERQVIAFLRLMVRDVDLLILDEATANIDSVTEVVLQKATEKIMKGRTSIIVAHRLSTIKNCDRVIKLAGGEIISQGSPEEVLRESLESGYASPPKFI